MWGQSRTSTTSSTSSYRTMATYKYLKVCKCQSLHKINLLQKMFIVSSNDHVSWLVIALLHVLDHFALHAIHLHAACTDECKPAIQKPGLAHNILVTVCLVYMSVGAQNLPRLSFINHQHTRFQSELVTTRLYHFVFLKIHIIHNSPSVEKFWNEASAVCFQQPDPCKCIQLNVSA